MRCRPRQLLRPLRQAAYVIDGHHFPFTTVIFATSENDFLGVIRAWYLWAWSLALGLSCLASWFTLNLNCLDLELESPSWQEWPPRLYLYGSATSWTSRIIYVYSRHANCALALEAHFLVSVDTVITTASTSPLKPGQSALLPFESTPGLTFQKRRKF